MATLALRIEPAPLGSGIEFRSDVEPRYVPLYLFKTVETFATQMEAYVREALTEGLAGWQVTDCRVTMTDCGYASPVTSAADFRRLTQLVLTTALERAGTWVCEPLVGPRARDAVVDRAGRRSAALGRLGGRVTGQFSANGADEGRAPCCRSPASARCSTSCPGLSMGEGILETRSGGYQPIGSNPPTPAPLDARARSTATPGSRRSRSVG